MITTTPSRLGKESKRSRRGGTLVVVAIMFTVLMGISAMALDFSRMYEFRAQIKTLADAAAMSAILDRRDGRTEVQAETNAFLLTPANRVEGSGQATMVAGDITPVTWHPPTRIANDTPWNLANAVKVAVHYTSNYTMARIFGATSKTLNDTTIALFGSLTSSNCLVPLAISYAEIVSRLPGNPAGSAPPYNMNYDLTQADLAWLRNNNVEIQFHGYSSTDETTTWVPGNFGWLDLDPNANGTQALVNALTGCVSGNTGVGSTVNGATGNHSLNGNGTLADAMRALCDPLPGGGRGGGRGGGGGPLTCDPSNPPILVPIYSSASGQGGNALFTVKYIGLFKFTRWDGNDLYGILTATDVAPTGEVAPTVGPATVRPQIVK